MCVCAQNKLVLESVYSWQILAVSGNLIRASNQPQENYKYIYIILGTKPSVCNFSSRTWPHFEIFVEKHIVYNKVSITM